MTRLIIQLGRYGDIINLLPLAYHAHKQGERWGLMVAKEFAGLLDGVSYVDPIVFDGEPWDLVRAHEQATKLCDTVQCSQVVGNPEDVKRYTFNPAGRDKARTESFQRESWDLLGRLDVWKLQPALVFDQRNKDREAKLLSTIKKSTKKTVALCMSGVTSPFLYQDLMRHLLAKYNVVDIGAIKAERIYDLLAIMEKAHCVIAIDSAPLHLAYALNVPVCALINDKPSLWHGSTWRPNHIFHCRYADFPIRCVDMLRAMDNIGKSGWFSPIRHIAKKRVIHAWSMYELSDDTMERHLVAKENWRQFHEGNCWINTPMEPSVFGRDSRTVMKDPVRVPFLKDVVRNAGMRCRDEDVIVLTRSDTIMGDTVAAGVYTQNPCFARRAIVEKGQRFWHPNADLFAFTKDWWRKHQHEIPDLLMSGDNYWSRVMLELFKAHGATELEFAISRGRGKVINHGIDIPPRIRHNETLSRAWLMERNIKSAVPPIADQCELFRINGKALRPFGYNPSITRFNGKLLMAYRWHSEKNHSTALAMAELDAQFSVLSNQDIVATGGNSIEDPRWFHYQNKLWLAYVDSQWPAKPTCQVRYGFFDFQSRTVDGKAPVFGNNNGTAMEKNWLFFADGGGLYTIYDSWPKQTVLTLNGELSSKQFDGITWPWGQIKGGAIVEHGQHLLRFFHSRLDNEPAPYYGRYYVGAMLLEKHWPFNVVNISKKPILAGSELSEGSDQQNCAHWKANVVFPGGAIDYKDGWLLSIGINDSQCGLAYLTERQLHF
jgi:predicted GH43/DUF377 family glycosyl hydrolase